MARVVVRRSANLTAKLKALRTETQGPVRDAMALGAQGMIDMAKRLVPDGAGAGAYDLGESIRWRFGEAQGGGSDAKTGRSASTSITISAGDENNHEAGWVEFGTAPRVNGGQYAGTQHPGTPPQPYFYPSYRANKKAMKRRLNKAIRDAVQKVAKQ